MTSSRLSLKPKNIWRGDSEATSMDQERRTVDNELPTSPLPTTDTADDTDEVQFAGATPCTDTHRGGQRRKSLGLYPSMSFTSVNFSFSFTILYLAL